MRLTSGWRWFTLYWVLFCALLSIATVIFWPRGKQARWRERFAAPVCALRRLAAGGGFLAFAATGGWVVYNTKVLNRLLGPKDLQRRQADYEKSYKPFDRLPQPRVRSVKYAVDIYPESRNMACAARK